MANPDRPSGFKPVGTLDGGSWVGRLRRYEASDRSSDTTNNHGDLYIGDPVKITSGKVLAANSGDTVLGVVVGFGDNHGVDPNGKGPFDPTDLETRYLSHTNTAAYVWVAPAQGCVFEVQTASDLDLTPGDPADFSTDAAEAHGDRTTGLSTCELVANANGDVVVVDHVHAVDNDETLANARHVVRFTTTEFTQ